jgi:hypothetical protein
MLSPALICLNPGPIRHRRLVTDVLTMAALQICDPITLLVLVEPYNGPMHFETPNIMTVEPAD